MANKSISQLDTAPDITINDLMEVAIPDVGSATGYISKKDSFGNVADAFLNDFAQSALATTDDTVVGAINELNTAIGKVLTGTLTAGNTSLVLSDAAVLTTSMIDIYTDVYGLNPTAVTVAVGSITLTFEAQQSDVSVKVVVK